MRRQSRHRVVVRALIALVAAATLAAAPARAEEDEGGDVFSAGLRVPNLGPTILEQDPVLPDSCDLPAKDAAPWKALGRSPGPAAVAHDGGGSPIDTPAAGMPFPQV